jgi:ketosteroid isomerase-like protein
MSDHPNAVRARRAFELFNQGEFEDMVDLFSEDVVAYTTDSSQEGATVRVQGKANLFETLGKYDELAGGTMHVDIESVLADDEHVITFMRGTAQRPGRTHDFRHVVACRVGTDGRWKEIWYLSNDQRDHEQFWAE